MTNRQTATELQNEVHNKLWQDNDEILQKFNIQFNRTMQSIKDRNEALERIGQYAS